MIPQKKECRDYGEVIAFGTGYKVVAYKEFGSYQGDYIAILKDKKNFYIYKDGYGSCSGCDWLQAEQDWTSGLSKKKALEYCENLKPFATVPITLMKKLLKQGDLRKILPRNSRLFREDDYCCDVSFVEFENLVKESIL